MTFQNEPFGNISEQIQKEALAQTGYALELCKHLHQNPELSYQEFETGAQMAAELREAGFEVTEKVGGNNVVGILKQGDGPVVMLRTDMDALPVEEKTGLPFASTKRAVDRNGQEVPVMHACGHDIHMAVWTGTIRSLAALKNHWKGTLVAIAQQAEEVSGGAREAIRAGLFSRFPKPDCALACHINPELKSGQIGLAEGPVFAGEKAVRIRVYGQGGHGAYPHKCIDPIVIASRIVLDLQTVVSREISPLEPAVLTVGSMHGGTRHNIIPDEVNLQLTLRYYSGDVIEKMETAIRRISRAAAQMAGMPQDRLPEVTLLDQPIPPVWNQPELSSKIRRFAAEIIGPENLINTSPTMAGEDFGMYGHTPEKIPLCLIWLGSTSPELMSQLEAAGKTPYPLHSPRLRPDYRKTIKTGINVMTGNVIGLTGNR